jgi:hypothetical protein
MPTGLPRRRGRAITILNSLEKLKINVGSSVKIKKNMAHGEHLFIWSEKYLLKYSTLVVEIFYSQL